MKKYLRTLIFCSVFFLPVSALAAPLPAGIQGRLWFSQDPIITGETVTVYALVYNSSDQILNGMIQLHDGSLIINKKPFTIDAHGGSRVLSFPVLITAGSHSFYAILTDVALQSDDGSTIGIFPTLSVVTTSTEKRTAVNTAVVVPTKAASSSVPALVSAAQVLETTSAQVVGDTMNQISDSAPVSVAAHALPFIGGVEAFRSDQAESSLERMHALENILPVKLSTTSSSGQNIKPNTWTYLTSGVSNGEMFKTPFRYIELFLLLVWNFLTAHVIVFYALVIFLLYKLVRGILGVFF